MTVRIEAGRIVERAKLQHTAPLRMPLHRFTLGCQPAQGGTDQGGAGRGEERSPAEFSSLRMSVHPCPPHIRKLRAITPSVHKQHGPGSSTHIPHVPVMDIGYRAGASDGPGVNQVSRESRSRARSSTREASVSALLLVANPSFYARSQVLSSAIQSPWLLLPSPHPRMAPSRP